MKNVIRKNMNAVDEINVSKDVSDIQNILSNLNPRNLILNYFIPGMEYNFRLLGPFVSVKRLYIPCSNNLTSIDLLKIFNGNEEYYNNVINELSERIKSKQGTQSKSNKEDNPTSMPHADRNTSWSWIRAAQTAALQPTRDSDTNDLSTIMKLYNKKSWGNGIMVNAMLDPCDIKVLCLGPTMIKPMQECRVNGNISGLFAHNIRLRKNGSGMTSNYTIRFSDEPLLLDKDKIEFTYNNGLVDIKKLIRDLNSLNLQQNTSHLPTYIYDKASDYKMSEELSNVIFKDFARQEESKHFERVDENISEIPKDSFEGWQEVNNAMVGIELD